MAYIRHTWVDKEIIREEPMNNIEQGIYNNDVAISDEVSRATGAEGTLNTAIGAEVTRATDEEARLEGLINGLVPESSVGVTVASLEDGKVPSGQLPSYVDDVVEGRYEDGQFYTETIEYGYYDNGVFYVEPLVVGYYNTSDNLFYEDDQYTTLITPVEGTIYESLDTTNTYAWDGTQYVSATRTEITPNDDVIYVSIDTSVAYLWNGTAYEETTLTPIVPERGKIYVDLNTNDTYRWSGSVYIRIGGGGGTGSGDMLKSTYDPDEDGVIAVPQGGTGATSASGALANLGAVAKDGDSMSGDLSFTNNATLVLPINPSSPPSANGAIWITT